jgi:hypothetical protein
MKRFQALGENVRGQVSRKRAAMDYARLAPIGAKRDDLNWHTTVPGASSTPLPSALRHPREEALHTELTLHSQGQPHVLRAATALPSAPEHKQPG